MRSYLSVPSNWYLALLGVNFGAAGVSFDQLKALLFDRMYQSYSSKPRPYRRRSGP